MDYGYEAHMAEVDERERRDHELRSRVLDGAIFVEHELLAIAARYLGGGDTAREAVVDRLIGKWGGTRAAMDIVREALSPHDRARTEAQACLAQIKALLDLRHSLAHGTTESRQANPPEVRDGRLGRQLRARTLSGAFTTSWVDFDEAEAILVAGRRAAIALSRLLADLTS